ncbi:hypothetical protein PR048_017766 [Dryococelus australis]|uniref:Uncharacterized protein n=1 Tax=Dryococelus australis TaxID=614101 RepID=A0ABQ9HAI5_9NEOP|nr:hypothetical protein PR048_017766 [Dryococelus australis]
MLLVSEFSQGSPVPCPCIPALFHTQLASPSSALKTSMLGAPQISPLQFWAAINTKILRADGDGAGWVRSGVGGRGWGKWEIPQKTHRPVASSGTIATGEGRAPPGIELGSPWSWGLNPGLPACEAGALPLSYTPIYDVRGVCCRLVGMHTGKRSPHSTESQNSSSQRNLTAHHNDTHTDTVTVRIHVRKLGNSQLLRVQSMKTSQKIRVIADGVESFLGLHSQPPPPPWIFACGNRAGRCRWSAGFLDDLPFPQSFHSGAAPHSHHSLSSPLKTSMLRAVQISSLTLTASRKSLAFRLQQKEVKGLVCERHRSPGNCWLR